MKVCVSMIATRSEGGCTAGGGISAVLLGLALMRRRSRTA